MERMEQGTIERAEPDDTLRAFAQEISRQCRLITTEETPGAGADAAFWEAATADAWE